MIVSTSGWNVSSMIRDGVTYTYACSDAGSVRTTTVTDPNGGVRTYVGDMTTYRPASFKDQLNRQTSDSYDNSGPVTEIVYPERNIVNQHDISVLSFGSKPDQAKDRV